MGLSKKATCLSGRVAVWPKLISADVYQCLPRWPQPQGQNPQKIFPWNLATNSKIINDIIFLLNLLKRFNNFGHAATRPRIHVSFLDMPSLIS